MAGKTRRSLGEWGEGIAAQYLTGQGFQILAQNWRLGRVGELDLVAQDGPVLVIVEVRTRRGRAFGSALESVTPRKQSRLSALAEAYAAEVGWEGPIRIDVVSVERSVAAGGEARNQDWEINHVRNAVGGTR